MRKFERKSTSLWGRKQILDVDHDKKNEQAEAELGQAQSKLGLFQKDFELWISFGRLFLSK